MRLLLTTVSLDSARGGGTAERTRKLTRHLRHLQVSCRVATIEGGDIAGELTNIGVSVYVTGFIRVRFVLPFISITRLAREVRESDVVHVLGIWNMLSVMTTVIARANRVPYTLSAAGEFATLDSKRLAVRLFHWLFVRRMVHDAKALIAITQQEKQQIHDRFAVDPSKICVIPNGIDSVNRPADETFVGRPYVLFVGRLAPIKGPDFLVDAFSRISSRFPGIDLVIAGPDFGMADQLKRRVSDLSLQDRVSFYGFIDEARRNRLLFGSMFLAVPSRSEAMSLVAVEAGAAGKPVLVTDQCGLEEVRSLNAGVVCPASAVGLEQGLVEMLTCQDLQQKAHNWKTRVTERYLWSTICRQFVDLSVHLT